MYGTVEDFQRLFQAQIASICLWILFATAILTAFLFVSRSAKWTATFCFDISTVFFVFFLANSSCVVGLLSLILLAMTAFSGSPEVNTPLLILRQVPPLASHSVLSFSPLPPSLPSRSTSITGIWAADCWKLALYSSRVWVCLWVGWCAVG